VLEPQKVEMLNGMGVVLMQEGKSERAMEIFERCMRLAPTYDRPYLNMAVLYLAGERRDKAHDLLSDFLRRNPDNEEIRQALQEVDSRR
jgi:Flp pilus assembly protein TadD